MRHRATSLGEMPEQRPLKTVDKWLIWGLYDTSNCEGYKTQCIHASYTIWLYDTSNCEGYKTR